MANYDRKPDETATQSADVSEAVAPEVNGAAQAQSAELRGGGGGETDPQTAQADEALESERVAAAKAGWEKLLGEKLGGKAFDLIRENVSFSDLQGHAMKGTEALADLASAPFSEGKLSAGDAAALNALAKAFAPELQKIADEWLKGPSGTKVFTAISQWVEESPKAVTAIAASLGALAIGAAVAAIIADADPPEIEKMFKIGKNFEIGGKVDLASIKNFAVESAELSMQYSAGGFTARLTGGTKTNEDGSTTQSVVGSAGYETKGFAASADATYNSDDGVSAGAEVKGDGGTDKFKGEYLASIRVNAEGETEVIFNGGIETVIADLPAEFKAGLKQTSGDEGSTSIEAEMKIGEDGNQQTVKGSFDPDTGAFTLNFGRTAYDGAANFQQQYSQDADGNLQTEQSLDYKVSDNLNFNFGQTTTGDQTDYSAGVDFTTGKFKNSMDLEMKDSVSTLSLGTAGTSGNFNFGANTRLNIGDARLEQLGLNLGWRDPNAFKSATLKYKLDWQQENQQYAHQFETVFEHSVGKWDGRFTGDASIEGNQFGGANADLLLGRSLNDRWKIIGGVNAGTNLNNGMRQNNAGARIGVQFDNVGVTFGVDKTFGGETQTGFRIEIPLGKR